MEEDDKKKNLDFVPSSYEEDFVDDTRLDICHLEICFLCYSSPIVDDHHIHDHYYTHDHHIDDYDHHYTTLTIIIVTITVIITIAFMITRIITC